MAHMNSYVSEVMGVGSYMSKLFHHRSYCITTSNFMVTSCFQLAVWDSLGLREFVVMGCVDEANLIA